MIPGGAGRSEVQVKAWAFGQLGFRFLVFVGGVIVQD